MNINNVRELFTGTKDKVFLDSACVGLAPTTVKTAFTKFLDLIIECKATDMSSHHLALDEMKNEAMRQAAILFKTDIENVSLIESTTHGLNIAANSIPFEPSDEVLICDTEYLQVAIPFAKKNEAKKLKLVPITSSKDGRISLLDIEKKLTANTKAICLSSVQWCTGQRIFSKSLGSLCQSHGIWLIVDGVQEAGALNIDVNLRYCDFYVAGGHKWLNSPYGCGIMYLSKRAQELEPPSYGYLNLEAPKEGWGKYFQNPAQTPFREYIFPVSAKSFGIGGTSNYPGAIGLSESIKIVNTLGAEVVEERILKLTAFLHEELRKVNVRITPELDPKELSGITIFRISDSQSDNLALLDYLLTQRIFLSMRYTGGHGGIRVSCHYFNNEDDIAQLCRAIRNYLELVS